MSSKFLLLLTSAGIIFQSIFLLGPSLRKPATWRNITVALTILVVCFLLYDIKTSFDNNYDFSTCCLVGLYAYLWYFSYKFSKQILSVINLKSLLVFNLFFLYNFYFSYIPTWRSDGGITATFSQSIMIGVLIPSILVLIHAIFPFNVPFSRAKKVFFYCWYLIMSTIILSMAVFTQTTLVFSDQHLDISSGLTAFSLGLLIPILFVNLYNAINIIPLPQEYESMKKMKTRIKHQVVLVCSKYVEESTSPQQNLLLTLLIIGFLAINYYFIKLDPYFVISIAIIASHFLFKNVSETQGSTSSLSRN